MLIKIFLLENGGTTCKIVETQIRCHNVASDLGLHFFAITPLGVSSMKWVIIASRSVGHPANRRL